MIAQKPIGEFLLEEGIVSAKQIEVALKVQKCTNGYLGEILEKLDFVSSEEVARMIAQQQKIPFFRVEEALVDSDILRLIPKEVAEDKKILPIKAEEGKLYVAACDVTDITILDYLNRLTELEVHFMIADKDQLFKAIELNYYQLDYPIEAQIEALVDVPYDEVDIVKLLELILEKAIKDRATDVHITPDQMIEHIFFRIDGVLQHIFAFDLKVHAKMVARTKILANLDIAEQRMPQDGGLSYSFLDQDYDLRLSTLPTHEGENIVIRILSPTNTLVNLENLDINEEKLKTLKSFFLKPFGMVLVTGPTGSGKTTTLYAALREVDALSKNILTIEDPIEYRFAFIKQTQINEKLGYTFSKAIRHFIRQDPDVMLVGEIRDEETARLAVRASITGHLVLSTLHTNSAVATIPRILDMGIDPDLIATSLVGIVAQRLVRKVCPYCAENITVDGALLGKENGKTFTISQASIKGCSFCKETGYHGRVAIMEVLSIDETIKELISRKASTVEIEKYTKQIGMQSIKDDGFAKVIEGITTLSEINRVTL